MTAADPLLPAWSRAAGGIERLADRVDWPPEVTPEWAWGGSTGRGVRVCVVDSGIESSHPKVGRIDRAVVVEPGESGTPVIVEDEERADACGHGTACAGIIRSLAPECELSSVRVLGRSATGTGELLLAGLRWAVQEGYQVINLSLSTTKRDLASVLHELTDRAFFGRSVLVASAHNRPVDSYPWRFASVVSVGSHERAEPDLFFYNPEPPVEFFARGVDVEVAWAGGTTLRTTGNSFATPHMAGMSSRILAKHPALTPFQLKSVLYATAANVRGGSGG